MKIVILASAERDLEEGWRFFEDQEAGIGDYFLDTLMNAIRQLPAEASIHPCNGPFHRALVRKFHSGIYYTVESDHLTIRRILDLRRNPQWIRRELNRSR